MKNIFTKRSAATIGLISTLIYIFYCFFAYLYDYDFFSYYSFDLILTEMVSLLLIYLDYIMLAIYLIFVIWDLKGKKVIQYILLGSILVSCIKLGTNGLFPYTNSYFLDILFYISYLGLFMYILNIFDIIKIKFANNKFFILCVFINILPWIIYLFIAPEILIYFIVYLIGKIGIIPFFYNNYV